MKKTVLSLLNYIGCIGMVLFVTFVIDGTIGMVLTYALVIALVASLVMTLAILHSVKVQPVLNAFAFSKGDKAVFDIRFTNSGFLPVPVISVEIENSAHFQLEGSNEMKGSVTGKGANSLTFNMTAKHSGKAHIKIKGITVTDYLGIFSFKLKTDVIQTELTAAVYPDIPEVFVQTGLVTTASLLSGSEEEEEESDETSAVPTGLAGYDHREYTPGDPIKRINWKLSSKRDILMVRLDEKIKNSGRTLMLDLPAAEENEASLTVRDNVIEGAMAVLNSMLAEGRESTVYYCKQGFWMSADIHLPQDFYALQEELSDFEPSENAPVIPPELLEKSNAVICFTSAMGGSSASAEYIIDRLPDIMIICSYASSLPVITENQWALTDGFELNRM